MKKKLIMGSLLLCCMILVTAIGSAFARKFGEEKTSNIFSASEHYNLQLHNKETEIKHTEPYFDLVSKNENLNNKPGNFLQGLIVSQIVIVKTIGENPVIISR